MNLSVLFPPPYVIQRRAWEAAYVLITEYLRRLDQGTLEWCAWRAAVGPERLGWSDISRLFRIYRTHVGQRV